VIITPSFTDGEDDMECKARFLELNEYQQMERAAELWRRLFIKAKGGAKIV